MSHYAGVVIIVRKDNTHRTVTVENVLISGSTQDEIRNNPSNLIRALRYAKPGLLSKEERQQTDRWRIKEILITATLGLAGGPPLFHNKIGERHTEQDPKKAKK